MRRERIGDVAAVVVCTVGGVLGVLTEPPSAGLPLVLGLAAGTATIAAIPLRHRYPVALTVVSSLVGIVTPLGGYVALVGVYTTAVLRRWSTALATTLFALVTSLIGGSLGHATGPDGRHVLTASLPWPAP